MNPKILLFAAMLAAAPAAADQTGGPTILEPANGATVTSPVTIVVTPMPAEMNNGVHLHLIVDAPLPAAGTAIPMDAKHLHLMHGETRKTLTLTPGPHTLQLLVGSAAHQVAADAPHSDPVTIEVK